MPVDENGRRALVALPFREKDWRGKVGIRGGCAALGVEKLHVEAELLQPLAQPRRARDALLQPCHVGAYRLKLLAVGIDRARILGQILLVVELYGVDKDADNGYVVLLLGPGAALFCRSERMLTSVGADSARRSNFTSPDGRSFRR